MVLKRIIKNLPYVVIIFLASAAVYYLNSHFLSNKADNSLKFVNEFQKTTHSKIYCRTGDAGIGPDNLHPWAEYIFLSDQDLGSYTESFKNFLNTNKVPNITRYSLHNASDPDASDYLSASKEWIITGRTPDKKYSLAANTADVTDLEKTDIAIGNCSVGHEAKAPVDKKRYKSILLIQAF